MFIDPTVVDSRTKALDVESYCFRFGFDARAAERNSLFDVMLFLMFSDSELWLYPFFLVIFKACSINIVFVKWTYILPTMLKGTWPCNWALPTPHVHLWPLE